MFNRRSFLIYVLAFLALLGCGGIRQLKNMPIKYLSGTIIPIQNIEEQVIQVEYLYYKPVRVSVRPDIAIVVDTSPEVRNYGMWFQTMDGVKVNMGISINLTLNKHEIISEESILFDDRFLNAVRRFVIGQIREFYIGCYFQDITKENMLALLADTKVKLNQHLKSYEVSANHIGLSQIEYIKNQEIPTKRDIIDIRGLGFSHFF